MYYTVYIRVLLLANVKRIKNPDRLLQPSTRFCLEKRHARYILKGHHVPTAMFGYKIVNACFKLALSLAFNHCLF